MTIPPACPTCTTSPTNRSLLTSTHTRSYQRTQAGTHTLTHTHTCTHTLTHTHTHTITFISNERTWGHEANRVSPRAKKQGHRTPCVCVCVCVRLCVCTNILVLVCRLGHTAVVTEKRGGWE